MANQNPQTITIGAQFANNTGLLAANAHKPTQQGQLSYAGGPTTPADGTVAPGFDQNDLVAAAGLQNTARTVSGQTVQPQMPFQDVNLFIGAMCAAYGLSPGPCIALVMEMLEAMTTQGVVTIVNQAGVALPGGIVQ